jgi:hypothetical protein
MTGGLWTGRRYLINFGDMGTLDWKRLIVSELIEAAAVVASGAVQDVVFLLGG